MVTGSVRPTVFHHFRHLPRRQGFDVRDVPLQAVRWLQAAPRDVVTFAQRNPRDGMPAGGSGAADLRAGLTAWQSIVARLRVAAVARRWLVAAAVLALLLCLVDRSVLPLHAWTIVAASLALAVSAAVVESLRTPSLDTIARLADRHLGLKEQVASGLEVVEKRATITGTALNSRLEARAAALVGRAQHDWVARLRPARGEWLSLVALWAAVAVLLLLPHPARGSVGSPAGADPSAISPATSAPYHFAFPVPPLASTRQQVSMRLQVAVMQTPIAGQPGAKTNRTTNVQRPVITRKSTHAGAQSAAPATGTAGKAAKSSNTRGGLLPQAPDGPRTRQQSGAPGSSSVSVYSNRYRAVPPSGNSPALPGQSGMSRGAPQGQTSSRASTSTQAKGGTSSGASRPANGPMKGPVGPGGAPPGQQGLSYMNGQRLLPSQLPKPGLITGKGSFTGRGTPGGLTAGSERSLAPGRASQRNTVQGGQGRQLALQSAYGARQTGDQTSKTVPGKGAATAGQAHVSSVGAQQGGLQTIDYVPPDGNYVAPDDRGVVARYFVPHTVQ